MREIKHAQPEEVLTLSAPLNGQKNAALIFASQARKVRLKAAPQLPDLYQATFFPPAPLVRQDGDRLIIRDRQSLLTEPADTAGGILAEVDLSSEIPWEIEFHGDISDMEADLGGLWLRSLDILGRASGIDLVLSQPHGDSYIYISGGIRNSMIYRPVSVGLRVYISGRVNHLIFDNRHIGVVEGETRIESRNFKTAASRYEIYIAGLGSHLVIGQDESSPAYPAPNGVR